MISGIWRLFFPRPTSTLDPSAVEAAVRWWRNVLKDIPRRILGDPSPEVITVMMLAALHTKTATDPQLEKFVELLRDEIHRQYAANGKVHFRVDYHPEDSLRRIARKARVPEARFPSKTTFVIHSDGAVEVACGYHAPWERIWPEKSNP